MAIWNTHVTTDQDVYTVLYLLKDALRSALEDAWFFERTACPKPDVKGASGHAELAARLGRFRDACNIFKEREALMLTKLLRAREWARQLRRLTPSLQEDIDQFLDATSQCHRLQADFLRDAQRMFHGGGSPSRFLSRRQGEKDLEAEADGSFGQDYLVGGRTALLELRVACEVFLSQIEDEFFSTQALEEQEAGHEDFAPEDLASNLSLPLADAAAATVPPGLAESATMASMTGAVTAQN